MKLSMSTYEILSSGSVIVPEGEKVIFTVENLDFIIDLQKTKSSEDESHFDVRTETSNEGKEHLLITLFYKSLPFFASNTKIYPVAVVGNKEILLNFSCVALKSESTLLFYTWYKSKIERKECPNGVVNE